MTDLIERLQHCSANTTDAYLHELTGRAADRIRELEQANAKQAMLIAEFKGFREPRIEYLEQRIRELEMMMQYYREGVNYEQACAVVKEALADD